MNYAIEHLDVNQTGSRPAINALALQNLIQQEKRQQLRRARADKRTFTLHEYANSCMHEIQHSAVNDGNRPRVESFIQDVFQSFHNARLNTYLPELFSLNDHANKTVAAVGVRHIDDQSIFLEQYLTSPIEECVSDIAGSKVRRQRIVEVGNLASQSAGSSRSLIAFLVNYLADNQIDWAVCTGTNAVRAVLKRMGINFELIQRADPECLGDDKHRWGTYYEHNPFVLAVDIQQALDVLQNRYNYQGERYATYS